MSYQTRSRPPEHKKTRATPEETAAAALRAVKAITERLSDEMQPAASNTMYLAIIRALQAGIPTADVERLTGYSAERIQGIKLDARL